MKEITELFTQASDYESMGDLKSAINIYNKILEIDISNYDAKTDRSLVLKKLGELDGSMNADNEEIELKGDASSYESWPDRIEVTDSTFEGLNKDCELNPNAQAYFKRGLTKLLINEFEDAIQDFNKTIELDPRNYKAYNNRGAAKFLKYENYKWSKKTTEKDFDEMIADFTSTIELNSIDAIAYFNRGYSRLHNKRDLEDALNDFNCAININPNHAKAYYERGQILMEMEDYEKAVEDYKMVISLNPYCEQPYYDINSAMEITGNKYGALENFLELIKIDPSNGDIYYDIGSLYLEIEEYENAEIYFTKAISIINYYSQLYLKRGIARGLLNNFDGANNDFNEALKIRPDNYEVYIERAKLGNDEKLADDLEKAISIDPENPEILCAVAKVKDEFYGTESTTDYLKALRTGIKKNNNAVIDFAKDSLAYLYNNALLEFLENFIKNKYELDDPEYKELVDRLDIEFSELIELCPTWEEPYFNRGYLRIESLHDYHGAVNDYDKYIELQPYYGLAYYNRGEAKFKLGDSDGAKVDFMKAKKLGIDEKYEYYGDESSIAM